jgi:hypothetical protein
MVDHTLNEGSSEPLIKEITDLLNDTKLAKQELIKGAAFGRNVESSIHRMANEHIHMIISTRKKDQAIAMPIDDYRAFTAITDLAHKLILRNRELELSIKGDEFEALYAQMQSPETQLAVENYFDKDELDLDLASTFAPGRTEV